MQPFLTPEQWTKVDAHVLEGHVLLAIMSIRKYTGIGIKDAIDINHNRYQQLRETRPLDFKCSDEEYWQGYYS